MLPSANRHSHPVIRPQVSGGFDVRIHFQNSGLAVWPVEAWPPAVKVGAVER